VIVQGFPPPAGYSSQAVRAPFPVGRLIGAILLLLAGVGLAIQGIYSYYAVQTAAALAKGNGTKADPEALQQAAYVAFGILLGAVIALVISTVLFVGIPRAMRRLD
jgi:hypothetical protein